MADLPPRICPRCGHIHIGIPIQPITRGLFYCARCGTYALIREMGEMDGPHERADPESWGNAGWA